jgi:hypothetical protein
MAPPTSSARASGHQAPPGGPLPRDFNDVIGRLAVQAEEEERAAEEARRRAARKPFSRFVIAGVTLIAIELGVLWVYRMHQSRIAVRAAPTVRNLPPENSCGAVAYRTYWQVVKFLKDTQHPPAKLDDLIPRYLDQIPVDPITRKPLEYSTDGKGFDLHCPGRTALRK